MVTEGQKWTRRPAGIPSAVPPPPVPLSYLGAAALGLIGCGAAWIWAAGPAAGDPTSDRVVAAAHMGMLATLSMGVLGAVHQFVPVVTGRPLRSVRLAYITLACWAAAAWLLPAGFATGTERVVEAGGALAAVAVVALVANLSAPLAARGKGSPVTGLRFALAGFVATACFGVVYVADRRGGWWDLSGHVVLAHATIGVFAWLGLAYVAVAEKLFPMFFLAHVPGRRISGRLAVWSVPVGVSLLSPGLLFGLVPLAAAGAGGIVVGLGAHLVSLAAHTRHRKRPPDLHLLFVLTSAMWLPAGAGLALGAALVIGNDHHAGMALSAGSIAAFGGWLLETLVGHVHKVVPFVGWAALRSRGIDKNDAGKQLLFGDLYSRGWAVLTYGAVTAGIAALCVGLATSTPVITETGGACFVVTGLIVAANLSVVPVRMIRHRAASVTPAGSAGPTVPAGPDGSRVA